MSHPVTNMLPECAALREQRTCISRSSEVNSRTVCPGCQAQRDSDSVIVPTGLKRRFRASKCGWKKCISVTAAFCFVFIVGGLCPGGVAAPTQHQGSPDRMERSARSDRPLWRNPCGHAFDADQNGDDQKAFDTRAVEKVNNSARNVLGYARDYQDLLAKVKMSSDFNTVMQRIGGFPSVLEQSWYTLPKKALGEPLEDPEYYEYALQNLPAMYKYLELLIGAMETIPAKSEFSNLDDSVLRDHLVFTLSRMTSLLCEFDALLMDRRIRKLKSVEREEVPVRPSEHTEGVLNDVLVFRDTLNFLEIMEKVFEQMSERHQ